VILRGGYILGAAVVALLAMSVGATAQELTLAVGEGGSVSLRTIQLILLVTVLSLAPAILIMVTCFPFMVTVFAILRMGIGLQQSPPNMLIISLSLFLTYFVMEPVFLDAWQSGIAPLLAEEIPIEVAFVQIMDPFRGFMAGRIDPDTFAELAALRPDTGELEAGRDAPLSLMVPSFLLSEISRAFQVGFLIFLPFLIIDLVVAAVLMSMGMMMVPPAVVSLPFKLAFFVVADGWSLVAGALVRSYGGV